VNLDDLTRVQFFSSHEGLNLDYEEAQCKDGYCLTTHMPWIGERTRGVDGPHVGLFARVKNPIGVKLSAGATSAPW
jgi:3-deoxy-7-phosphoheptulonate synthase